MLIVNQENPKVASFNTGKSVSKSLILESDYQQYEKWLCIDYNFRTKKIQVQNMLQTIFIFVHNLFWTCIFLVLNLQFNEQSIVILWVSWSKKKCFWQRIFCTFTVAMNEKLKLWWLPEDWNENENKFWKIFPGSSAMLQFDNVLP